MITIQNDPTTSTDMCTNRKRLLHCCSAQRTILRGVLGSNCNHRDIMHMPIVLQPTNEGSPSCIMDRFSEFAVAYHVPDLKVFIGNQVARRDIRVCYFPSKILTLPLDFQMLLGKSFSSLFFGLPTFSVFGRGVFADAQASFQLCGSDGGSQLFSLQSQSGTLSSRHQFQAVSQMERVRLSARHRHKTEHSSHLLV